MTYYTKITQVTKGRRVIDSSAYAMYTLLQFLLS